MGRPRCSIVAATSRPGGLDVALNCLEEQSFQDFELVFVDCLYKYRKDLVLDRLHRDYSHLRVKYIEPFNNRFPVNIWSHCQNTALAHVQGDVVIFVPDYSWLDSNCVARHVRFHDHGGPRALLQPYHYMSLPPLRKDFQPYITGWTYPDLLKDLAEFERLEGVVADRMVQDLEAGKLKDWMWSIFEHEFTVEDLESLHVTETENKSTLPYGPIDYNRCYLKNESFPTSVVLDCGAFNEEFDGSHGFQDTEFAGRLTSRGIQFWNDPIPTVYIINPRDVLYYRKIERLGFVGRNVYESARSAGFPTPVNSFDLADVRRQLNG